MCRTAWTVDRHTESLIQVVSDADDATQTSYLAGLPDAVPSAVNLAYCLGMLADKLLLQKKMRVCGEMIAIAASASVRMTMNMS